MLDESLYELRDTVQGIFVSTVDLIAVEVPPADTALNLLPDSWRDQRAQVVRRGEWRKRLIWAGGAYAGLLVLFLIWLLVLRLEIGRLGRRIDRDAPAD